MAFTPKIDILSMKDISTWHMLPIPKLLGNEQRVSICTHGAPAKDLYIPLASVQFRLMHQARNLFLRETETVELGTPNLKRIHHSSQTCPISIDANTEDVQGEENPHEIYICSFPMGVPPGVLSIP